MIPFPNLFPPPEIWDKIPPLSSRKRKIGILREASILVTAAGAVIYAGSLGVTKFVDMLDDPAPRDSLPTDVTKVCLITEAAPKGSHGFDLSVLVQEDPVGTKNQVNMGPIYLNATVESAGQLNIFGKGLEEPRYLQHVDGQDYHVDTAGFPDGQHTYTLYNRHDMAQVTAIGPLPITDSQKSVRHDPCGSVWLSIHQGNIAEVKVVDD